MGTAGGLGDADRHAGPAVEEMVAAIAAVRIYLRRRDGNRRGRGTSRWARTGRAEGVAALAGPIDWATAERPR